MLELQRLFEVTVTHACTPALLSLKYRQMNDDLLCRVYFIVEGFDGKKSMAGNG